MKEFRGKTAVVTGGASGVGRSLCEVFAQEGMSVVVADIEESALSKTVQELTNLGVSAIGVLTDVTDSASVEALADRAFETFGAVHILCNNAGVGVKEAARPIWTLTSNDWHWCYAVNVHGVANGIRAFLPRMIESGEEGHVVNTTSANGGCFSFPTTPVYASSKAAVTSLTEVLNSQLQMQGTNITAHLLFPGPHLVNTNILASQRNRHESYKDDEKVEDYLTMADLERASKGANAEFKLTEPQDVALDCLAGIRNNQFWIRPYTDEHQDTIRRRTQSMLSNTNPDPA